MSVAGYLKAQVIAEAMNPGGCIPGSCLGLELSLCFPRGTGSISQLGPVPMAGAVPDPC